jgi:hypothetical protein
MTVPPIGLFLGTYQSVQSFGLYCLPGRMTMAMDAAVADKSPSEIETKSPC